MRSGDVRAGDESPPEGAVLGAEPVLFWVPERRRKGAEHGNERVSEVCVCQSHTLRGYGSLWVALPQQKFPPQFASAHP